MYASGQWKSEILNTNSMKTEEYIKSGRRTAFVSFFLGTAIFVLYYLRSSDVWLFAGYGFIVFAGLINLVLFLSLCIRAKNDTENRGKLLWTCGLMLLNIPVMLLYCWGAIILLDTLRITFTNSTQSKLTNINIVGCGGGHIDQLDVGEDKTVWVVITGDCSITIDYLSNGQLKNENVAGYVTKSMGQKLNHNIGGK